MPLKHWYHDPRWRLLVSGVVGLASIGFSNGLMHWTVEHGLLIGWAVIAFTYSIITTLAVYRMSPAETAAHARAEDFGGFGAHVLLITAAGVSLLGLVTLLIRGQTTMVAPALLTFIVVVTSWATIQVTYTLRYAKHFYQNGGGIDFNQDEDPQYSDFAYLAFTMGMAFQVSDTMFKNSKIRRIAFGHALLTYVFGTIILASAINIVTGLTNH